MIRVAVNTGRLVEVTFAQEVTPAEVRIFSRDLAAHFQQLGQRAVLCVDVRGAREFSEEVRGMLAEILEADPGAVERAAFVSVVRTPMSALLDALLGSVGSPWRRHLPDMPELLRFLGEVLTTEESERLEHFLGGPTVHG